MSKFAKNDADLIGETFNRLLVLAFCDVHHRQRRYYAHCNCGAFVRVLGSNLRRGRVQSCGCLRAEVMRDGKYRHGRTPQPKQAGFDASALAAAW